MIVGIGVDCTSVSRLAASIQRPHFVQRVFGQAEQALLQSRGGRAAETAAANFAAKEAFLKAVGTGLGGFALADIQAVRRESGRASSQRRPCHSISASANRVVRISRGSPQASVTARASCSVRNERSGVCSARVKI